MSIDRSPQGDQHREDQGHSGASSPDCNDQDLSPIAVFVYNRPRHTRRTLKSLMANPEAAASPMTIYCDGPRDEADTKDVEAARDTVRDLAPAGARVVMRETNLGLANSIIGGVTEQCSKYGRVIVIEDDLVLSHSTLRYLNAALSAFRDQDQVMHISAYMFPVRADLPPAFFYREATCWGWATWERAWRQFEPDPKVILDFIVQHQLVSDFDVRGSAAFWKMLELQCAGKIDSWAIRWYGSVFMNGGLALQPRHSFVRNEGFDGTGIHCGVSSEFEVDISDAVPAFPTRVEECEEAVLAMIDYRLRTNGPDARPSPVRRFWRGVGRFFPYLKRRLAR